MAGSSLVAIVGVSVLLRTVPLRVPSLGERELLILSALRTVVVGALAVIFVSGAFGLR